MSEDLGTLYFLIPWMDFVHIWHDYRYLCKIFFGTIPSPDYDLEVKVKTYKGMMKFCVKVFNLS